MCVYDYYGNVENVEDEGVFEFFDDFWNFFEEGGIFGFFVCGILVYVNVEYV